MKVVTEFSSFTLSKSIPTFDEMTTAQKTPEEIQQAFGESTKLEGDKLKYFIGALSVAKSNAINLKRVLVLSLNEGESAPAKAQKVDENYYLPEFFMEARQAPAADDKGKKGKGGGRRDNRNAKDKKSNKGASAKEST